MKTEFLALIGVSLLSYGTHASPSTLHHIVKEKVLKSQSNFRYLRPLNDRPNSYTGGKVNCEDGTVVIGDESYDCNGIDLYSFLSSEDLVIPGSQYISSIEGQATTMYQSSDIWGWRSPNNGKELTLLTLDTGLVIIDSTEPETPCIIVKAHSARNPSPWGDVKVVGNYAYTIKDKITPEIGPSVGMEVYELTQYENIDCSADDYEIPNVDADWITPFHGSCHNVVSNTETGRIYSVGCRDTCDGGLVIMDVKEDPLRPALIGCVFEDGYTHDAQCVKYSGPDTRYTGREICFAFNEDTLTTWDVTDAAKPVLVSRIFYANQAYSHQGWLTADMSKIMLDDELDEVCNEDFDASCRFLVNDPDSLSGKTTTTTNIFDVSDLQNPVLESVFDFADTSIDHNLYVWGTLHQRGWGGNEPLSSIPDPNLAYMHNYMAGLRVVDVTSADSTEWIETQFFDITNETVNEFFGVWSGYMHPSGVYAISSIEKGVFFLDTNVAFVDAPPLPVFPPTDAPTTPTASPTTPTTPPSTQTAPSTQTTPSAPTGNTPTIEAATDDEETSASPVLYVFFVISLIGTVGVGYLLVKDSKKAKAAPVGNAQAATL